MDRLIYTVLTGLSAQTRSQTVTANNLANAGTPAFRREIVAAEGRYLAGSAGEGGLARVQAGAPSLATPHQAGKVAATGRQLDIALAGDAWLAVQGPIVDGRPTETYTRRGDLVVTPTGLLQTGEGHAVLAETGSPVSVPAGAALEIGADGNLSARLGDAVVPLGRLKLVAGATLTGSDMGTDGQFHSTSPLPADPGARLTTGTLESSNVETNAALTELVEQSRSFQVNARLLGIAKDIDERTARLMTLEAQ